MKKKPRLAADKEGKIMPAAKESLMYFFMTLVSGADRDYSQPLEGDLPVRRSVAWVDNSFQ